MRISGPCFLVKGGDAVLMLRSVERKYDRFMTEEKDPCKYAAVCYREYVDMEWRAEDEE
jgi:hypothetical protein